MAVLKGHGQLEGVVVDLDPDGTSVGRDPTQSLILEDHSVSSKHAKIWCEAKWLVEDLGSTNKTLLNGAELDAHEIFELRDGDRLSFGVVALQFDAMAANGAIAEARAALDAASQALERMQADLAALRDHVGKQDQAIRSRDEALKEWEKRMHEVNASWVSKEDYERELAAREAKIRAEAARQVEAAVRRYQEMESRFVQATARIDSLERTVKDRDEQLQHAALRRA